MIMAIEWFEANKALPTVTVAAYGLTLNTSAANFFKDTQKIKLGLDADIKKVYMKTAEASDEASFAFHEIGDKSTARISCRDFVQFVSLKTGINIEQSNKYYATWVDEMLTVDLEKKIQKNKKVKKS
jgi:hypothetical protein